MSNTTGTLLIAFCILSLLTLGWSVLAALPYFLCCWLLGDEFSWAVACTLFAAMMLLRSFYPRNIFAG